MPKTKAKKKTDAKEELRRELVAEAQKLPQRQAEFDRSSKALHDYQRGHKRALEQHEEKLAELKKARSSTGTALARSNTARDRLLAEFVDRKLVLAQNKAQAEATRARKHYDRQMSDVNRTKHHLEQAVNPPSYEKKLPNGKKKTVRPKPKMDKETAKQWRKRIADAEKVADELKATWEQAEQQLAKANERVAEALKKVARVD